MFDITKLEMAVSEGGCVTSNFRSLLVRNLAVNSTPKDPIDSDLANGVCTCRITFLNYKIVTVVGCSH